MPAVEEDAMKPEHESKNQVVEDFRKAIDECFERFLNFYNETTESLKSYRLKHVELVSEIYNGLLTVKGDRIEEVRQAAYELNDLIDEKREELGRINECLQGVINTHRSNSEMVGIRIQRCALIANQTLSRNLEDIFYPTFAQIQQQTSTIPISVIDILSSANVLQDEQEILVFMEERHRVMVTQWLSTVSVFLTWETNRFRNEGLFLRSDMEICMGGATWEYLLVNSRLEGEVQEC
jgi:hypothetical protein